MVCRYPVAALIISGGIANPRSRASTNMCVAHTEARTSTSGFAAQRPNAPSWFWRTRKRPIHRFTAAAAVAAE